MPAPASAAAGGWKEQGQHGAGGEEAGEGGGWRRGLEGVRKRTGGPRLPESGSVPWARESLAGSLREKFPEAAVMETAQRWAGRGSEPGTQMGKGWEETSWETRGAKETQSHADCCTMALGLTQRHRRHPGVCILIQNLVFVTPSVELKYNKRRFSPSPMAAGLEGRQLGALHGERGVLFVPRGGWQGTSHFWPLPRACTPGDLKDQISLRTLA